MENSSDENYSAGKWLGKCADLVNYIEARGLGTDYNFEGVDFYFGSSHSPFGRLVMHGEDDGKPVVYTFGDKRGSLVRGLEELALERGFPVSNK